MDHGLEKLIGKTITDVEIPDETTLIFQTTDGPVKYYSSGDCCAQCFFDELEVPDFGKSGGLCSAADLGSWEEWPEGTDDTNEQCFGKVDTTAGTITFTLRLNHNGYYGGEMSLAE